MRIFLLLPVFLLYFLLPDSFTFEQKSVLITFCLAAILWTLEMIPLFATSIVIVVLLSLIFPSSAPLFFGSFASPVIFLFFGGFILARALQKHEVDQYLLTKVLRFSGSNPYVILASLLALSAFFSMWISNTASAALIFGLSQPIFSALKKNDPFKKGMALSIAFGCNIGGMTTPIGTPPNAVVMGILREYQIEVTFFEWFIIALPLVIGILCFVYFLLIFWFKPKTSKVVVPIKEISLSGSSLKTAGLALGMVFLWFLQPVSLAWVSILGVALFTSMRLINYEDICSIDWPILLLIWGGLALGQGIEESKILAPLLPAINQTQDFYLIAGISVLALILSTFISNTATANLLLPFAVGLSSVELGLIAIPVALCCSLAMGLPVSTPPNAILYSKKIVSNREIGILGALIGVTGTLIILAGFWYVLPFVL